MAEEVSPAHAIPIRDAGFDEYWLQDQIGAYPSALGLGGQDALSNERRRNPSWLRAARSPSH